MISLFGRRPARWLNIDERFGKQDIMAAEGDLNIDSIISRLLEGNASNISLTTLK